MTFRLKFVTPDGVKVDGQEITELTLPAYRGEIQILPGHAHLLTTLGSGIVHYQFPTGEKTHFYIQGGYCQVTPETVDLLVEQILERPPV